jgi:hypothetical protein
MTTELLVAVLTSSVAAGVISAIIGGWFALRSKRNEYENAYFKIVLDRRVRAYEQLENLVTKIKVAVLDKDGQPYHLLFSDEDSKESAYKAIFSVMSSALWLSDDIFEETRRLNVLIYSHSEATDTTNLIEFGKEHYREVAELRTRIEKLHTRDMLTLHQVPAFLRSKKPKDSYVEIRTEA